MRTHVIATILALLLVPTAIACKKDDAASSKPADKKPSEPKKDEPAKPAEDKKPPVAEAPKPAAADALVDYDLSSQGAAWAGWTVKGPAGAKVEADEGTFPGATAIKWGNGMGAVGFRQAKLDVAFLKKEVFTVGRTTVTKDTPDAIEATMEFAGTPLKCFYLNQKVGATDVSCWTAGCIESDADVATARAICASLAKK